MEENTLDLRHTLAMLWRERYVIVAVTLAASFASLAISALAAETYIASARVLIQPITTEDTGGGLSAAVDPAVDTSIDTQAAIMSSGAVAARVSKLQPSIDQHLYTVDAAPLTDNVVQLQVSSRSPRIAADVANAYVEAYLALRSDAIRTAFELLAQNLEVRIDDLNERILFIDQELAVSGPSAEGLPDGVLRAERDDLVATVGALNARKVGFEASAEEALAGNGGQIVQHAVPPSGPSSPDPVRDALIGVVLGSVLGVGFCFLKDHLGRRIYTFDDASRAARAPVLASLPRRQQHPWNTHGSGPTSGSPLPLNGDRPLVDERVYEACRVLRAALAAHGLGGGVSRLVVLSAERRQGAVPTVVGLGVACAAAGLRTAVVAADLKDRYVDWFFGSEYEPGLTDILTSNAGVREALRKVLGATSVENLSLLPGGVADVSDRDPLASPRLALVLKELSRSAAVVLIASPPVSDGADATILVGHADAAVLAVRMRSARAPAVRHAADMMAELNVPLLGMILLEVGRLDGSPTVSTSSARKPREDREGAAADPSGPVDARVDRKDRGDTRGSKAPRYIRQRDPGVEDEAVVDTSAGVQQNGSQRRAEVGSAPRRDDRPEVVGEDGPRTGNGAHEEGRARERRTS